MLNARVDVIYLAGDKLTLSKLALSMDKFDPPPPYPDSPYNLDVLPPHEGLVSVDFNPNCIEPGGFFTNAEFENFPTVLQRANAWLAENPAWEIRTCETVEYSMHSNGEIINESSSSYVVHGQRSNRYVRGLRLWLQPSSYNSVCSFSTQST